MFFCFFICSSIFSGKTFTVEQTLSLAIPAVFKALQDLHDTAEHNQEVASREAAAAVGGGGRRTLPRPPMGSVRKLMKVEGRVGMRIYELKNASVRCLAGGGAGHTASVLGGCSGPQRVAVTEEEAFDLVKQVIDIELQTRKI